MGPCWALGGSVPQLLGPTHLGCLSLVSSDFCGPNYHSFPQEESRLLGESLNVGVDGSPPARPLPPKWLCPLNKFSYVLILALPQNGRRTKSRSTYIFSSFFFFNSNLHWWPLYFSSWRREWATRCEWGGWFWSWLPPQPRTTAAAAAAATAVFYCILSFKYSNIRCDSQGDHERWCVVLSYRSRHFLLLWSVFFLLNSTFVLRCFVYNLKGSY